jgi:DNA helicase HerA-like ATPase
MTVLPSNDENAEPELLLLGSLLGYKKPLVPIPLSSEKFSKHTAILAQSGSGKSFFLGRLVEELLLKTECKVLILDPNSDFVRIHEVEKGAWEDDGLKPWFTTEDTLEKFERGWNGIGKLTLTNRSLGDVALPFRVLWSSLTEQEATTLLQIDPQRDAGQYWLLITALAITNRDNPGGFTFFKFEAVAKELAAFKQKDAPLEKAWTGVDSFPSFTSLTTAEDAGVFITKLHVMSGWGIWATESEQEDDDAADLAGADLKTQLTNSFFGAADEYRLVTVDLQSLDSLRERQLVTALVLNSGWTWATRSQAARLEDPTGPYEDQRRPVFIVIDEAHNLVPASTHEVDDVHEQIVRIAAEGRKYDLFLIVVTQSPRKIDANVLSQCENVCILKSSSEADLRSINDTLGYPPVEIAKLSITFGKGDAVLAGPFVKNPLLLHAFPRRTQQGGKSLSDHWANRRR